MGLELIKQRNSCAVDKTRQLFSLHGGFIMLKRLFIAALWSLTGKGLTSWLSFVMFNVFSLSLVVSWVRCGTW